MKTDDSTELLERLKAENRISPTQVEHFWPTLASEAQRAFAQTAPVLPERHWDSAPTGGAR